LIENISERKRTRSKLELFKTLIS